MRRSVLTAIAVALLLPAMSAMAEPPTCTAERPDISDQCLTTAVEDCMDTIGESVTVQIGGPNARDSNGDGGTCVGTNAIALVSFTKISDTAVSVKIDNRTCGDNGSVTALFHNITETVASYTSSGTINAASGTQDVSWAVDYSQTTMKNDGFGFRADGFGNFDNAIYNGNSASPNGGDKRDIRAGEIFEFPIAVTPSFNLCDFLTEISEEPPGERRRNAVGRWQACGLDEENSAYVGPCEPDDELLAVIDNIRLVPGDRHMRVEWSTSLEIENAGFNVLRREATRGGWERVNVDLLPGQGDTVTGYEYTFVDESALNGLEYMYRIEDIDFDGKNDLSEIRKDVVNPRNPRVRLIQPAYGASIDLNSRPRFGFEGSRSPGGLTMQISGDPNFPEDSTLATHVSRRFGSSEFTLDPRTSRLTRRMAQATEGIVYWRLVDRGRSPVSDTFRMEVQDSEVAHPGSGYGQMSRVGGVN